ncbi:MAG: hypothetical protein LBJ98_00605 [Endomicrobium sp.]|nr:hypothetical protein [Endomicrobium sp.]
MADTAIREEMSGSPVFYMKSEGFMVGSTADNTSCVDKHGLNHKHMYKTFRCSGRHVVKNFIIFNDYNV